MNIISIKVIVRSAVFHQPLPNMVQRLFADVINDAIWFMNIHKQNHPWFLAMHKKRVLLRKYQLMQPTYISNIGLYHAMYSRYIFMKCISVSVCIDMGLSALLWPGPILLTRRPWPYVIHHLHFMNIYRLYIAW
jgi:hypothetical protein